jgi:hypothetical protein
VYYEGIKRFSQIEQLTFSRTLIVRPFSEDDRLDAYTNLHMTLTFLLLQQICGKINDIEHFAELNFF